ncbi:MAG: metallophosphoesterase [Clostridia bacterium]|nr:metallophosphoesterase [Clostridia bacterium]
MFILLLMLPVLLLAALWWGNSTVELKTYEIEGSLPESFQGFTIVQISDLHNCSLGKNNKRILDKIKEAKPHIIVMTGDMIDSRRTNIDISIAFVKEALKIAPCYYVTGNHEARVNYAGDDFVLFKSAVKEAGVVVLENESCEIVKGNEKITLIGLEDTGFDFSKTATELLCEAMPEDENYKILLAHRPEFFDEYTNVDLIFSGHAHGGQIRLPFIGGLFAPGQGILPKYDNGLYNEGGRTMVVSRGLGASLFPIRINNRPQVVSVKLKAQ